MIIITTANHIEKCLENIAGGEYTDQLAVVSHGKAAKLMLEQELSGRVDRHIRGPEFDVVL